VIKVGLFEVLAKRFFKQSF